MYNILSQIFSKLDTKNNQYRERFEWLFQKQTKAKQKSNFIKL